jgi:leucyl aminopeptidase (aminopeptidase T)
MDYRLIVIVAPSLRLFMNKIWYLVSLICFSVSAVGQEINRPNWENIADLLINKSVQVQKDEKIIIRYNPERENGMMPFVREAIAKAGGIIIAEITYPVGNELKHLKTLSSDDKIKRQEIENKFYKKLFAEADIFLRLHSAGDYYEESMRWEKLAAANSFKGRNPHFHWFLPSDSHEKGEVMNMYERALAVSSQELEATQVYLENKIKGRTILITDSLGTNLIISIAPNAYFHHNNGDASKANSKRVKSVRDIEQELPASGLRTNDVTDINGKLVGVTFAGNQQNTVTVTFKDGKVIKFEAQGKEAEEFIAEYEELKGDKNKVAEILIGTNPQLKNIMPSGFKPYYGSGYGNINIRLGDNWETGGKNRVTDYWQGLLYVINGTLKTIDGEVILKDGNFTSR